VTVSSQGRSDIRARTRARILVERVVVSRGDASEIVWR
jgi:hypothetical protein